MGEETTGRKLAVAVVRRDLESFRAEVAFDRAIADAAKPGRLRS
jgi:hypothetical protein